MAGRTRRGEEPLAVRAARERERHLAGVASFGFLFPRRPRRSVTVTPAPLRYWQFDAARWVVVVLVLVAAAVWLAVIGIRDGASAVTDELPLVVVLAVLVVLGSTGRLTVSDTALSTDIAGLRRASSFGVVPLSLVREVVVGAPPADWPRARGRGGWWPGRTRVAVRHLAPDTVTDRALTVWVRDPEAFADALDRPL
ncbi:hypothetical protein [Petropleomorpha daqingensis]|uniref:PH domain-containing protein n=1 Tax=Petropleomorpha daqingensis TaxID=2026353 RepID=A0A853CMD2_9ACTN|nr:hypothetical protein [Petropleomorpha daqingensis]